MPVKVKVLPFFLRRQGEDWAKWLPEAASSSSDLLLGEQWNIGWGENKGKNTELLWFKDLCTVISEHWKYSENKHHEGRKWTLPWPFGPENRKTKKCSFLNCFQEGLGEQCLISLTVIFNNGAEQAWLNQTRKNFKFWFYICIYFFMMGDQGKETQCVPLTSSEFLHLLCTQSGRIGHHHVQSTQLQGALICTVLLTCTETTFERPSVVAGILEPDVCMSLLPLYLPPLLLNPNPTNQAGNLVSQARVKHRFEMNKMSLIHHVIRLANRAAANQLSRPFGHRLRCTLPGLRRPKVGSLKNPSGV